MTNKEYSQDALASLQGKWGIAIAGFFAIAVIYTFIGQPSLGIGAIILGGPLSLGGAMFALKFARNQEVEVTQIFDGFQNFVKSLVVNLIYVILMTIGLALLVVPGIIIGLGLSMSFFILADNPEMEATDVLKRSWEITNGYKMQLFFFMIKITLLSFLCLLTLGIGLLWLIPYIYVTMAKFYENIK